MATALIIHIHTDTENLIGDAHAFLLDNEEEIVSAKRFDGIIVNVNESDPHLDYVTVFMPLFEVVDEAAEPYEDGSPVYKLRGDKLDSIQLAELCRGASVVGREIVFVRTAWAL